MRNSYRKSTTLEINTDDGLGDYVSLISADEIEGRHWCRKGCGRLPLPRWAGILSLILFFSGISFFLSVFVLLPALIQSAANRSVILLTQVNITHPTEHSFWLSGTGHISVPGALIKAQVDEMDLIIEYNGHAIGSIHLPPMEISSTPTPLDISTNVTIEDQSVLSNYTKALIYSQGKEEQWKLKGSSTVTALGMNFYPNFDVSVPVQGMSGLDNITVLNFTLPGDAPSEGVIIRMNVSQWNPSPVSISLGGVTFQIWYQQTFLGQVSTDNMHLVPGSNPLQLSGVLLPSNISIASVFMSNYLTGKTSTVNVKGLHAGSSAPEWIHDTVRSLSIDFALPGLKNSSLVSDLIVETMAMTFRSQSNISSSSNVSVHFNSPFNFTWDITAASMSLELVLNETVVAQIESGYFPALTNRSSGIIRTGYVNAPINVTSDDEFETLIDGLVSLPNVSVTVVGKSSVFVKTPMGNLSLTGIPFTQAVILPGLDSLLHPPIVSSQMEVVSGSVDSVEMKLTLEIENPSYLSIFAPSMPVLTGVSGTWLGNNTAIPFHCKGNTKNFIPSRAFMTRNEKNKKMITSFFSNYAKGKEQTLDIIGDPSASSIPYFEKALGNLETITIVPGMSQGLITYLQMHLRLSKLFQGIIPTQITINNPWPTEVQLTYFHQDVYLDDVHIAHLYENLTDAPIVVPPKKKIVSAERDVRMDNITIKELQALIGVIYLTIKGELGVRVGDFEIVLDYFQTNVTASVWPE